MCHAMHMRMHIEIDDAIVAEIDRRAGERNRSNFIRRAITSALEESRRWEALESAAGSIAAKGHDWDRDTGRWVREQRHGDRRRVG